MISDETDFEPPLSPQQSAECDIAESELIDLVCAASFHWFEVIDQIEKSKIDPANVEKNYKAILLVMGN